MYLHVHIHEVLPMDSMVITGSWTPAALVLVYIHILMIAQGVIRH